MYAHGKASTKTKDVPIETLKKKEELYYIMLYIIFFRITGNISTVCIIQTKMLMSTKDLQHLHCCKLLFFPLPKSLYFLINFQSCHKVQVVKIILKKPFYHITVISKSASLVILTETGTIPVRVKLKICIKVCKDPDLMSYIIIRRFHCKIWDYSCSGVGI